MTVIRPPGAHAAGVDRRRPARPDTPAASVSIAVAVRAGGVACRGDVALQRRGLGGGVGRGLHLRSGVHLTTEEQHQQGQPEHRREDDHQPERVRRATVALRRTATTVHSGTQPSSG